MSPRHGPRHGPTRPSAQPGAPLAESHDLLAKPGEPAGMARCRKLAPDPKETVVAPKQQRPKQQRIDATRSVDPRNVNGRNKWILVCHR